VLPTCTPADVLRDQHAFKLTAVVYVLSRTWLLWAYVQMHAGMVHLSHTCLAKASASKHKRTRHRRPQDISSSRRYLRPARLPNINCSQSSKELRWSSPLLTAALKPFRIAASTAASDRCLQMGRNLGLSRIFQPVRDVQTVRYQEIERCKHVRMLLLVNRRSVTGQSHTGLPKKRNSRNPVTVTKSTD